MNKFTQIDIATAQTQLEKDTAKLADQTTPDRVRARAERGVVVATRKIELLSGINWQRITVPDDENAQLAQSQVIFAAVQSVLSDASGYNTPMSEAEFKRLYW